MQDNNKKNRLTWAFAELNDAVQRGIYGSISFNMQDGLVINAKIDEQRKPIIDNKTDIT